MSDNGFCLALEQRILLDAAGAVTALDTLPDPDASHAAPDHHAEAVDTLLAAFGEQDMQEAAQDDSIAVVFVDYRVQNAEQLIDVTGHGGRVDVYTIGEHDDGAALIADVLATYDQPVDSLHIFSHGRAGELFLGTLNVTQDTLDTDTAARYLQNLSARLSDNADVLFYGCNVADGETGQRFVEKFALLSGTDVAASTDLTGGAHLGGNAVLEYRTGSVEALSFVDVLGMASYDAVLGPTPPSPGGDGSIEIAEGQTAVFTLSPTLADADSGDTPNRIQITSIVGGDLQNGSGQSITTGTVLDLDGSGDFDFRFVPGGDHDQDASFKYSVMDDDGNLSTESTFTIEITPVNDAPSAATNVTLAPVDEDDTNPAGVAINALPGLAFSDPDTSGTLGGIAVIGNDTAASADMGRWEYSTDTGASWHEVGTVSDAAALVLPANGQLRFVPAADYHGDAPDLRMRVLDNTHTQYTAGSIRITIDTATRGGTTAIADGVTTIAIAVNPTNDAPETTATLPGQFADIKEDVADAANTGMLVSDFLATMDGQPRDIDADTLGIYVTATDQAGMTDAGGTWQYNSGSGWTTLTTPLHLGANDSIRFVPNTNQSGIATLTYRVSDGAEFGSTAFTSTISVTADNDDPELVADSGTLGEHDQILQITTGELQYLDEDADRPYEQTPDQIVYQLTGLTTKGTLQRDFGGGLWITLGMGGLFSQQDVDDGLIRYTYNGTELKNGVDASDSFAFNVRDGAGSVQGGTFDITIEDENSALQLGSTTLSVDEFIDNGDQSIINVGVTDADNTAAEITFTLADISGITAGYLSYNGTKVTAADENTLTFTQQDLDNGKLVYVHDGSEVNPVTGYEAFQGPASVSFKVDVTDGNALGASEIPDQQITLNISPRNDLPEPQQSEPTVYQSGEITIDQTLLDIKDVDSQRSQITFVLDAAPEHGSLYLDGKLIGAGSLFLQSDIDGNKLVYKHSGASSDDDAFTYTVRDRDGGVVTETFTINVEAGSGFVVADDAATVAEGLLSPDTSSVTGNVLTNDSDPDGVLDIVAVGGDANDVGQSIDLSFGSVTINPNGSYTYTLDNTLDQIQTLAVGETLKETISYTVKNSDNELKTATLTITIEGTNDVPVAKNNVRSISVDDTDGVSGNVLRNDSDIDRDTLTVSDVNGSAAGTPVALTHGTIVIDADGNYTYTLSDGVTVPEDSYLTETVTYTVSDGNGGTDTATLTIIISDLGVDDINLHVDEDDLAGPVFSGSVLDGGDPAIAVKYIVTDDIDIEDDPAPDSNAGQTITTNYGTVKIDPDGKYTYTVDNDSYAIQALREDDDSSSYNEVTDTIEFIVEKDGITAAATFTVTIHGKNDIPQAFDDTVNLTNTDTLVNGDLIANDSDIDLGDTLTFVSTTGALKYGSLDINANGTFTYELDGSNSAVKNLKAGETLTDTVTYTVEDSEGVESTAELNVVIHGSQPIEPPATQDHVVLEGGTAAVTQQQLARTGTGTTYTVTELPTHGVLLLNGVALNDNETFTNLDISNGNLEYRHNGNEQFSDTFTYTVDGIATDHVFEITVTPVNERPEIESAEPTITVQEHNNGAPFVLTTDNLDAIDPEGQADELLFYDVTSMNGGSLKREVSAGVYETVTRFTAADIKAGDIAYFHGHGNEPQHGPYSFTVKLTDGGSDASPDTQTIAITVNNDNDAPSAGGGSLALKEGETVAVTSAVMSSSDSDADDTPDTVSLVLDDLPDHGALYIKVDDGAFEEVTAGNKGDFTFSQQDLDDGVVQIEYRHGGGEQFKDSFTFRAKDDSGLTSGAATVSFSIFPVNDAPIIPEAGEDLGTPGRDSDGNPDNDSTDENLASVTTGTIEIAGKGSHGGVHEIVNGITGGYEGEATQITLDMLRAYDPDNLTTQVQFRVTTGVTEGKLVVGADPATGRALGAGSVFTLADVAAGKVWYVHKGDELTAQEGTPEDSFTFTVSDSSGADEPDGYFPIFLKAVNDTPTLTAPKSVSLLEDSSITITGFATDDIDAGASDTLTLTMEVTNGSIELLSGTDTDAAANRISVSGTLDQLKTMLDAGIKYSGAANYNGSDSLTIVIDDNGHSGDDPGALGATGATNKDTGTSTSQQATRTVAITVLPVNDAPTVDTVPDPQVTDEDTPLLINVASVTNFDFSDIDLDRDSDIVSVILSVNSDPAVGGTISVAGAWVDGSTVSGNGGTTVTIRGTLNQLSSWLDDSITYTPGEHYNGGDTLTVTINDEGKLGVGGALTDTKNVAITINAVNDAPDIDDMALEGDEDHYIPVDISAIDYDGPEDPGEEVFEFSLTSLPNDGKLYTSVGNKGVAAGVERSAGNDTTYLGTEVTTGTKLNATQAANLIFVPNEHYNGTVTFSFTATDGEDAAPSDADATITVHAVNDAPEISGASAGVTYTEGAGLEVLGSSVQVMSGASILDIELTEEASDTFNGAILQVVRQGGGNGHADDIFSIVSGGLMTVAGTNISLDGTLIGTISANSKAADGIGAGHGYKSLEIEFNATASQSDVEAVANAIRYQNSSDKPDSSVQVSFFFNDGNAGAQGKNFNLLGSTTVTVNIDKTNDAPIGAADSLTTNEDATVTIPGSGTLTIGSDLLSSDPDGDSTIEGIAIVDNDADAAHGAWKYSLNGTDWTNDVPTTLSDGSALVLPAGAQLRFIPTADWNGTPGALSVRVLDATYGDITTATSSVDLTASNPYGGTTGIAAATTNITATVNPLNDAPELYVDGTKNALADISVSEVDGDIAATNLITKTVTVIDQDDSDDDFWNTGLNFNGGTLTVELTNYRGADGAGKGDVLTFTTNEAVKGSTYTNGKLVIQLDSDATPARVEDLVESLQYSYEGDNPTAGGTRNDITFTIKMNDGGNSRAPSATTTLGSKDSNTLTGKITIANENDAPAFSATDPINLGIDEGYTVVASTFGWTVEDLVEEVFTDADNENALLELGGIAVVANAAESGSDGHWQYKAPAGAWTDIGSIGAGEAVMLSRDTLLRFLPDQPEHYHGTPDPLTIKLVDDTYGGTYSTATPHVETLGSYSATGWFSSGQADITLTINSVNDTPTLSLVGTSINTFTEGEGFQTPGTAIFIDESASVEDIELSGIEEVLGSADEFNGATLTVQRQGDPNVGAPNAEDIFAIEAGGASSITIVGDDVKIGSDTIATILNDSNGTSKLELQFKTGVSNDEADAVIQRITYGNSNDNPTVPTVTVLYTFSDGNAATGGAQGSGGPGIVNSAVIINITPTNDAPIAYDNTNTVTEDTTLTATGNVITQDQSGKDYDPDGATATAALTVSLIDFGGTTDATFDGSGYLTVAGAYGDLKIKADGSYTYTLNNTLDAVQQLKQGATLSDKFTYTVKDTASATDTADLTITINGKNDTPLATDNKNTVKEDTTLTASGDLLLNDDGDGIDSDEDTGDTLSISNVTFPSKTVTDAGGKLTIGGQYGSIEITKATGAYTYTLNNANTTVQALGVDEFLNEVFTYTLRDGQGATDTATLTIQIDGTNDAPVGANKVLSSIDEDAGDPLHPGITDDLAGELVSSLGIYTDVDTNDTFGGIAVIGNTLDAEKGVWQFSSDGSAWVDIPAASTANDAVFISAASRIRFLPAANYHGSAPQLSVKVVDSTYSAGYSMSDGAIVRNDASNAATTSAFGSATTVDLTVRSVNDVPVFAGTPVPVDYTEGAGLTGSDYAGLGTPVVLAPPAAGIEDIELSGRDNDADDRFQGATLTLERNIGAASDDIFGLKLDGTDITISGNTVKVNGTDVATFTGTATALPAGHPDAGDFVLVTGTNGKLELSFVSTATDALVEELLRGITYANASDAPQASVTITFTFSDQNSTATSGTAGTGRAQGSGVVGIATANVDVTITPTNDTPQVDAALQNQASIDAQTGISVDITGGFTDVDTGDVLKYSAANLPAGLAIDETTGSISGTIDNSASQGGTGGVHTVTITATDSSDAQVTSQFTWKVTNPAPTAVNDTNTVSAQHATGVVSGVVLTNDTDPDLDTLVVSQVNGDADNVDTELTLTYGKLTVEADGDYTYTLDKSNAAVKALQQGSSLTDSVTYQVSDGEGGFSTATLTITITGENDTPTVKDGTDGTIPNQTSVDAQTGISVNVAGTFADVDTGDVLTYSATNLPVGLTLNTATGVISGTIDNSASQGGTSGVYTVTVTAKDSKNATVTNDFTWTVTNPAPTAVNDTNTLSAQHATGIVTGVVLTNDTDPDLDTLVVSQVDGDAGDVNKELTLDYGKLTVEADGDYTYTLDKSNAAVKALQDGSSLTDSVTYQVSDGEGGLSTATLTITITGENDTPTVKDGTDGTIPNQTSVDAQTGISVNVAGTFADVDAGDVLTYTVSGLPAGLAIDANTGVISGTIDNSASQGGTSGVYTVTVTAKDSKNATVTNDFTWTVTNPAPTAVNDTNTLSAQHATGIVTGVVLTNDTDPDLDTLVVSQVSGAAGNVNKELTLDYGKLTIEADGDYTYTLDKNNATVKALQEGSSLTDSVTYQASDGEGGLSTATLTITISGENDTPTVKDGTDGMIPNQTSVDAQTGISVSVANTFLEVDTGDVLTYSASNLPTGLAIDTTTGVISGTLDNSASQGGTSGVYTVTVTAKDSKNATVTNDFTWTVTNPAPTAVNDAKTISAQHATGIVSGIVLNNDIDPDLDTLVVSQVSGAAGNVNKELTLTYGKLTVEADGDYTYTLNSDHADVKALQAGSNLTDSVTYQVSDGEGGLSTATLTITITGANDAPWVKDGKDGVIPNQVSVDAQAGISVNVANTFADADDADTLSYSASNLPAGLTIDDDTGVISGTIDNSASQDGTGGIYSVTITATDSDNASVTNTFTWTVTNPAPTAVNDTNTVSAQHATGVVSGVVLTNDTDPDLDTLAVSQVNGDAGNVDTELTLTYGKLTVEADGDYTYTLDRNNATVKALQQGSSLTDSVTYQVSDGEGGFSTATLTITISGENDTPTVKDGTDGTIPNQTSVDAQTGISVNVAGTFADVDTGDVLTYSATNLPAGLTLNTTTGVISGTIDNSASQGGTSGVYTVTVTAKDSKNATVTNDFTWTVTNPAPTAVNDANTLSAQHATGIVTGVVLTNDTDPDLDTLVVSQVDGDAGDVNKELTLDYGKLTVEADGDYTYTLDKSNAAVKALQDGSSLTDSVTYQVSDGEGGLSTATLTITITGENDTPTVKDGTDGTIPNQTSVDAQTGISVNVAGTFADVDTSDVLTYSATNLPAGLTLNTTTGVISGTVDNSASQGGTSGVYTVTVTAKDSKNATVTNDFTWTVTNPPPVATDNLKTVTEDGAQVASGNLITDDDGNGVDNDPDLDTLTVGKLTFNLAEVVDTGTGTLTLDGAYGTLVVDTATGAYTYSLDNDHPDVQDLDSDDALTDVFTYLISDDEGGEASANLTITIEGSNENGPPVALDDFATTDERTPVGGNVLTNDSDPDSDPLTVVTGGGAGSNGGTFTLQPDGSYVFDPAGAFDDLKNGESRTTSLTYTASDGIFFANATLTVTVTGISDTTNPPVPTDPPGPTNPPEPTDPPGPTNPPEPTDPPGPTNPPEPTDPPGPTNPPEPTDPPGPTNPPEPTNPGFPGTPGGNPGDVPPYIDPTTPNPPAPGTPIGGTDGSNIGVGGTTAPGPGNGNVGTPLTPPRVPVINDDAFVGGGSIMQLTLTLTLDDQLVTTDGISVFAIPNNAFNNGGTSPITVEVTMGDGSALPDYIEFDSQEWVFRVDGRAASLQGVSEIIVLVTGRDSNGGSATGTFTINIVDADTELEIDAGANGTGLPGVVPAVPAIEAPAEGGVPETEQAEGEEAEAAADADGAEAGADAAAVDTNTLNNSNPRLQVGVVNVDEPADASALSFHQKLDLAASADDMDAKVQRFLSDIARLLG